MHATKYIRQDLRYQECPIPAEYWKTAQSQEVLWKYQQMDFYYQYIKKWHRLFQYGIVGNNDVSQYV